MMSHLYSKKLILFLLLFVHSICVVKAGDLPRVKMQTSMGIMEIELFEDKSPRTVKNFLKYVESKYYPGLVFHRVVSGWLIQGGGYDEKLNNFETEPAIRNEATNGLKNVRGTIAMARHWDPNSAESQFFINLKDNSSFDHKNRTPQGYGYCVFGKVVKGMDVADAIGEVETHAVADFDKDVPVEHIFINKVELLQ
jgi:cyclophilin family peptidyl-prolyl cis-trans isomerase